MRESHVKRSCALNSLLSAEVCISQSNHDGFLNLRKVDREILFMKVALKKGKIHDDHDSYTRKGLLSFSKTEDHRGCGERGGRGIEDDKFLAPSRAFYKTLITSVVHPRPLLYYCH